MESGLDRPPFRIRNVGHIRDNPRHTTPGTRQGDIMLYVIVAGRGLHRFPGGSIALRAGMVGLVPQEDCGITMADARDPYDHWFSRFSGDYAQLLSRAIIAARGSRFFPDPSHERIRELLAEMRPGMRHQLPTRIGADEQRLIEILSLLQPAPQLDAGERGLRPAEVVSYLQDRLDGPLNLEAMARHFSMTKTSLCRAVRQRCGNSPVALAEGMRIDLARSLLRDTGLNVTEVAHRVGYDDPAYFARVFRRHRGISPKRWQLAERKRRQAR